MTAATLSEPHAPVRVGAGHQDALDGVRAIAIALVVLTHVAWVTGQSTLGGILWSVIANGTVGVPIFFTLSGLLLYRPWARAALRSTAVPRAWPYLWRRALRILPAYWLSLLVGMAVFNQGHLWSVRTWFEMVTLTQNYDLHPWWKQALGPVQMAPIWSLSVEAAFYLLLPFLAGALHRRAMRAGPEVDRRASRLLGGLAAVIGASFAVTAVFRFTLGYRWIFYWEHLLPRSLPYFAAGMILTVLAEWARQSDRSAAARLVASVGSMPGVAWVVSGCALVLVATPLATPVPQIPQTPQDAWQYLATIALHTVVAVALIAPVAFRPGHPLTTTVLGNPVVRGLGLISYGIFLWHQLVIGLWYLVTGRPIFQHDMALVLTATVAVSVVLAAVSHQVIEKPALLLKDRWGR